MRDASIQGLRRAVAAGDLDVRPALIRALQRTADTAGLCDIDHHDLGGETLWVCMDDDWAIACSCKGHTFPLWRSFETVRRCRHCSKNVAVHWVRYERIEPGTIMHVGPDDIISDNTQGMIDGVRAIGGGMLYT